MRRFFVLCVLLLATAALAQSAQSTPTPEQPGPATNFGIAPAPKPGHPLDPNDVAILTGRYNYSLPAQQQPYATPQFYYSYPTGGSMFTGSSVGSNSAQLYGGYSNLNSSQFADVTTEATPFHLRGRQKPGFGPTVFFGNRTPGFGTNRWRPNLWSSPGAHFQAPTGSKSSPGPRP